MYEIRSFYKSNKSRVILYHQATQTRFLLEFFLILNLYRENIRPISPLNRSRELSFSLLPPALPFRGFVVTTVELFKFWIIRATLPCTTRHQVTAEIKIIFFVSNFPTFPYLVAGKTEITANATRNV